MELISLSKLTDGVYNVFHENGVKIGQFLMKEDGYYDFWPESGAGYWPAYILRELADKLDVLNKDWEDFINNDPTI